MIQLYIAECLTNLHVGNGEMNFNVVDNEVEKDPVLGCPTVNASGVKGALLEYFRGKLPEETIKTVFGDKSGRQGAYKFFAANMIARPLRVSKGTDSYILATSFDIMQSLSDLLSAFGICEAERFAVPADLGGAFLTSIDEGAVSEIEGISARHYDGKSALLSALLGGKPWAVCDGKTLNDIDLPVIARNCLENGISNNLWYEEVVPHKSRFAILVLSPDGADELPLDGRVVQFGGGASIGYGYCRLTKYQGGNAV